MNKFDDLIHQEKEKQKTLGKKPFYFKNSLKKDLLNEERYLTSFVSFPTHIDMFFLL